MNLSKSRSIYFNEEAHAYTDEYSNKYTSTTTLIHKYYDEFKAIEIAVACERIGRNSKHPKFLKYRGKSAKQLLQEWDITRTTACEKGSNTHNYLEDAVKSSTNYNKIKDKFINDKIYTIDDILHDEWIGRINLDYFRSKGIDTRYPKIYSLIESFVNQGWKIYAEVGVYDPVNLISGLIDLPLIRGDQMIIIDWKTNQSPIRFEAGYFDKDINGTITDTFIHKEEYFYHPIDYVPASVGNKYSMQLSGYGNMVELSGLKHIASILCHIRSHTDKWDQTTESVEFVPVVDLKKEFQIIKEHHFSLNHRDLVLEKNLFNI